MELHTIELKKFSENSHAVLADILSKVNNSLDIWVAFLTRHDLLNKDHLPAVMDVPTLKKALDVLDVMNFGDEEREAYEDRLKWLRIETNTLKKYEAKGREEGREEKALEVARKLLIKGMPLEEICDLTGLSESVVHECHQRLSFSSEL